MSRRKWVIVGSAGLPATNTPAWAQGGLDTERLKLYGGTYSADCASAAAPPDYQVALMSARSGS